MKRPNAIASSEQKKNLNKLLSMNASNAIKMHSNCAKGETAVDSVAEISNQREITL